jgi:hypothetical protein
MLQSKAGYIDARPLTASSKFSLRANVFRCSPNSRQSSLHVERVSLHFANPRDGLAAARERSRRINSRKRYRAAALPRKSAGHRAPARRPRRSAATAAQPSECDMDTHWRRSISAEASRQRQHVVATVTEKTAKRGSNIAIRWPGRC